MITVVSTVLNDKSGTQIFLEQMEAQTRHPEEIVIVDGGSKDGTRELLEHYAQAGKLKLYLYVEPGCNVARGRNLAIENAHFDLIASTDIGCEWDAEWLEELVAPLEADRAIDYVVGSWAVKSSSLQTPWAKTEFVLKGGYVFVATPRSDATSRSIAYRKSAWDQVGRYPEDLTLAADDSTFNLLLKKHQFQAAAAPAIRCYWHRFETLRQFLKESRRNFYGDGEAFIARKHFVLVGGRLALELLGLLSGVLCFGLFSGTVGYYLGGFGLLIPGLSVAQRALRFQAKARQLKQMQVNVPLLRVLTLDYLTKIWGLWGYILGFIHGTKACRECRQRLHGVEASPQKGITTRPA